MDIDISETKPLFFKLDPIPARLEVETYPRGATLYINGNRARNPYSQDVPPGTYEIFAEAQYYESGSREFFLAPGQTKLLTGQQAFRLDYVQRSGRPELVVASGAIVGVIGATAVSAVLGLSYDEGDGLEDGTLAAGGALSGAVLGSLAANAFLPSYIADNRALFVIGGMWIGTANGLGLTLAFDDQDRRRPAFIGSVVGLGVGTTVTALLSKKAPTYGRVSLVQSAALGGALAGGLLQAAWTGESPDVSNFVPVLLGLNVGLAAGLAAAYLPDQSRYGPTWKRIMLIDAAALAGAVTGALAGSVSNCVGTGETRNCQFEVAPSAIFALGGAALGILAGILLTRNVDTEERVVPPRAPAGFSLAPAIFPRDRADTGGAKPGLAAVGIF
jgi:hypothetical protein